MQLFKRFTTIVSAEINAALDTIDDPQKSIDYLISQLEDAQARLSVECAKKMAEKKALERLLSDSEERCERWQQRAEKAVQQGRDDLAREALTQQREATKQKERAQSDCATLSQLITNLTEEREELAQKIAHMKEKRTSLLLRSQAAKERIKAQRVREKSEAFSVDRKFEDLQCRVERWEAQADMHVPESRESAFEALERDAEIEKALAALKAKEVC